MESKRVAIYARVSTADQHTENQLIDLRRYAEQRGWTITKEYVDQGVSGAKDSRPALDELMADAMRRRFDTVAVWKFDRFSRSVRHLLNALDQFNHLGIDFISVQDAIDTSSIYGKMTFTIIGAVAELERELIRQRVRNGVQKARERGKQLGRPRAMFDIGRARQLLADGESFVAVGKTLGVSRLTVKRALDRTCPREGKE